MSLSSKSGVVVVGRLVVAGLDFFHKGAPVPIVVHTLPCSGVFNDICIACLFVVAEGAADLQGECRAGLHHLLVETGSLLAAQFCFVSGEEPAAAGGLGTQGQFDLLLGVEIRPYQRSPGIILHSWLEGLKDGRHVRLPLHS